MNWFFEMLNAAVYAVFLQNLIFSGGFGATESIRMARRQSGVARFFVAITGYSTATAVLCRLLDFIPKFNTFGLAVHAALYTGVLAVLYLLTVLVVWLIFKPDAAVFKRMGIAALNTLVLAVPLLNRRMGYTLLGSLGMGIGAGVAFALASALIWGGVRVLRHNKHLPKAFSGTPALFIYVAMVSMVLSCFTGTTLFA